MALQPGDDFYTPLPVVPTNIQDAVKVMSAYLADSPKYGEGQAEVEARHNQQALNTATRVINDYAMKGGDLSVVPQQLRQFTTPEYANYIASRGSGKWRDVLPVLAIAAGGLAGVGAFGGAAAGAGATGTEAAGTYGAAGEFAGTGAGAGTAGTSLAAQSAAIGSGSAAGTAAGTGVGTGTAATGTVGTAATGTALSRILNGTATDNDYLELAGQVAPSLISAYGSGKQADAYSDLANKYMAMGAPYRDELSRISADPNAFYTSPTATKATEGVLQRLSSQYGNPAGNPYAQALTVDALYDQYGAERDRLAGYGGLTQYASAAPGAASQAIGAQGTVYGDLGYGVGSVLNPPPKQMTLAELLRNARV